MTDPALVRMLEERDAEIEQLRTRLAIQFGMHPGGDLAKAAQAERDKAWTEHLIEREELKAEIERLRDQVKGLSLRAKWDEVAWLQEQLAKSQDEVVRLKEERVNVKRMLQDLLERHGGSSSPTPHYGVGRGGLKVMDTGD